MATKKRAKRKFSECIVHIQASFNNTLIAGTTMAGDLLCQSSAGACGFKGSRKGTPYAAQLAAEQVANKLVNDYEARTIDVIVIGPGSGRDSAIRSLMSVGLDIRSLTDRTPLPHNGCRRPKKRRV